MKKTAFIKSLFFTSGLTLALFTLGCESGQNTTPTNPKPSTKIEPKNSDRGTGTTDFNRTPGQMQDQKRVDTKDYQDDQEDDFDDFSDEKTTIKNTSHQRQW